jgi:uncharacterized membrane protein YidH (DUF202 family)
MSVPEAGDRTVLAWRRSGLSLVACGLAMVRGIGQVDTTRRAVAGGIVIALGVAVWGLYVWIARRRSAADLLESPRPARLADTAPIALGTAFIGLVCIVVDLWS